MPSHVMLTKTHKENLLSWFCLLICSAHRLALFYLYAALSMIWHVGIFIFVYAELAAMLVLVMKRDDFVHWALLHKTKWYFKTFITNCDFIYLQNDILNWLTSYNWNRLKTFFFFHLFIHSFVSPINYFSKMSSHGIHQKGLDFTSHTVSGFEYFPCSYVQL